VRKTDHKQEGNQGLVRKREKKKTGGKKIKSRIQFRKKGETTSEQKHSEVSRKKMTQDLWGT